MPATQTAETTTTVTLTQFAHWLAEQLRSAGLRDVRVWQGSAVLRIYRGQDFVTVTTRDEHYGGPLSRITGYDRGFITALSRACQQVVAFSIQGGTVGLAGDVQVSVVTTPAPVTPTRRSISDRRTGCPCGSLCETARVSNCARCRLDY